MNGNSKVNSALTSPNDPLQANGSIDQMLEQHIDGYHAYASGDRGYCIHYAFDFLEDCVACECSEASAAVGLFFVPGGRDVYYDLTGRYIFFSQKPGAARCGDDYIRFFCDGTQILCLFMAERDGGVSV